MDFLRNAELIDGVLYDMTAPTVRHQALAGEIFYEIKNHIRKKRGTCVVLESPVDMENERIITYFFEGNGIPVIYGMDAKVPVQIFEGELTMDFQVITRQLEELNLDIE